MKEYHTDPEPPRLSERSPRHHLDLLNAVELLLQSLIDDPAPGNHLACPFQLTHPALQGPTRWGIGHDVRASFERGYQLLEDLPCDILITPRSAFVEAVIDRFPLLRLDLPTARLHAELRAELGSASTPIGSHDLWLGASCLAHDLALATSKVRELHRTWGLRVEDWSVDWSIDPGTR